MLMALLQGKLSRTQENMEDILTSNVFGLLKYLPPEDALFPFLSRAQTLNGLRPFENPVSGATIEFKFWPWHEEHGCNGCEPDVELRITFPDGTKTYIFIECKYFSGKSGEEDQDGEATSLEPAQVPSIDQLARQWENLISLAKRDGAKPLLIYLTRDVGLPRKELEASERAVRSKSRTDTFSCCWLSWHQLYEIEANTESSILMDLRALLERLNLVFFRGFSEFVPIREFDWHFTSHPNTPTPRSKTKNNLVEAAPFSFSFIATPEIDWRFR